MFESFLPYSLPFDDDFFIIVDSAIIICVLSLYIILVISEYRGLKRTEYVITNKRIITTRLTWDVGGYYKKITNYYVSEVESFFLILIKNQEKPSYNLFFIINPKNEEYHKNAILICKPLKDIFLDKKYKFEITRQEGFIRKMERFVLKVRKIQNKTEIKRILEDSLGLNMIEPPDKWKKIGIKDSDIG